MFDTYNLYNLEAPFKEYLVAGNQAGEINADKRADLHGKKLHSLSIKNYLSDFRHFIGWMIDQRKSASQSAKIDFSQLEFILTPTVINDYKNYFITNNLPHKTINRRLSTVRKFCSFCISQGWLKENPAKKISNIKYQRSNLDVLDQFQSDLEKEKLDQSVITSYLSDVREFLGLI